MTTPPHDPLDPLGSSTQSLGDSPTVGTSAYTTGQSDSGSSSSSSTKDAAKQEAQNVKAAAAGATQQVAGTAKEQAGQVVSDVRAQTRQLAGETRTQLSSQFNGQRDKAVGGIRSLGSELRTMSEQSGQSGVATQLAREGAELTDKVADFIETREPAELLDEVRHYASRRPGMFLIGAAVTGMVVGRLTRGAVANRQDQSSDSSSRSYGNSYGQTTPSSYVGTTGDVGTYGSYTDAGPGYGTAQMDQLAYPAEGTGYPAETTGYAAEGSAYTPEEPGPYDVVGEQPSTTNPPEQGYRP
jgi:uncharacterized protein YjbJ (UPF0337 family)